MSDANDRQAADDRGLIEPGTAWNFAVLAEVAVGRGPISGMATTPDGSRLLVTNYGDDTVSVIDTSVFEVVKTLVGVNEPFAIAMGNANDGCAYVSTASAEHDAIAVIDIRNETVIGTHPMAHSVSDLVLSPSGKHLYASGTGSDGAYLAVLDTSSHPVDEITIGAIGTATECVRIGKKGRRLYVATDGPAGGQVVVIDTRKRRVIDTVEIGWSIRDIALSPDGGTAYALSCGPDSGAVIDIIETRRNRITNSCKLGEAGGAAMQLTVSSDGRRAYLVDDDGVTLMCALTQDVINAVSLRNQPSCVIESADEKYLYIADYCGTITVASIAPTISSGVAQAADEHIPTGFAPSELRELELALA